MDPGSRSDPAPHEELLDELFDLAVTAVSEGRAFDLEGWLAGREHLADAARATIQAAREVAVAAPPGAAALPGDIVPGYTILAEVGRGGMGTVYRARQERLERVVALKVLNPSLALSQRARRRFHLEARAHARLHHPRIVAVHDVLLGGELAALAMQWIPGTTLARRIGAEGRLAPRDVAAIGLAMAEALTAVHAAGLLHRDVKPANILIHEDGSPFLSDFGLVRDADDGGHTATGEFLGTAAFAAPEQLRGARGELGPWTDVYALGATLYTALSGRPPFSASSTAELLRDIQVGAAPPLAKVAPGTPRDLGEVVAMAMDRDRLRRYASAAALADDLSRFLRGEPVHARPLGAASRLVRWCERNPTASSAIALLVAGMAGTGWFAHAESRQAMLKTAALADARASGEVAAARAAENARLAATNADLARSEAEARVGAEARAAELEEVLRFQERSWEELDVARLGGALRSTLLERTPEAGRPSLEAAVAGVPFADVAVDVLQREVFGRALATAQSELAHEPAVAGRLLQALGGNLARLGREREALPQLREAVSLLHGAFGADDTRVRAARRAQARLEIESGDLDEAERICRDELERARSSSAPGSRDFRTALSLLSKVHVRRSDLGAAEQLLRDQLRWLDSDESARPEESVDAWMNLGVVLGLRRHATDALEASETALALARASAEVDEVKRLQLEQQVLALLDQVGSRRDHLELQREFTERCAALLGNEHVETITARIRLSSIAQMLDEHTLALDAGTRAFEDAHRVFGALHRVTLEARAHVAKAARSLGQSAEADAHYAATLEGLRTACGDDYDSTLVTMCDYGEFLVIGGRLDEAEALLREALDRHLAASGRETELSIAARNSLARLASGRQRPDEALMLYEDSIDRARVALGDEHDLTLSAQYSRATILSQLQRTDEALAEMRGVLERRRCVLGDGNPDTQKTLRAVCTYLERLRRYDEAAPLLQEAYGWCREHLGPGDDLSIKVAARLGVALVTLGREPEAEAPLREALAHCKESQGERDQDGSMIARELARVRLAAGAPDAVAFAEEHLARVRRHRGEEAAVYGGALGLRAAAVNRCGSTEEALLAYRAHAEWAERVLGRDHVTALGNRQAEAGKCFSLGRFADAEALWSGALEGWKRTEGAAAPGALHIQRYLGATLTRLGRHGDAVALLREGLAHAAECKEDPERWRAQLGLALGEALTARGGPGDLSEAEAALLAAHAALVAHGPATDVAACARALAQVYEALAASATDPAEAAAHAAARERWQGGS